jgi:PKD repeat protein
MKNLFSGILILLFSLGFTAQISAQVPEDWSDDTGILTFKEDVLVHEGSFSCGVDVTTDAQAECDFSNLVEIPLTAGETYKISFWYFTSANVRIRAAMDWVGSSTATSYSSNYGGPTSTGDWEEFTFEGSVPDDASGVNLRLRFYDIPGGFTPPETQYIDQVQFESPVGNNLFVANGNFEDWGAIQPEPTNYPTNFAANSSSLNVNLTWTDAVGAQLPDAYLILASEDPAIDPPSDGTFVINDLDLSDGEGAANVNYGFEGFTFTELIGQTTYYFKIFSYTNSGAAVDYKTNGTPPFAEVTTASVTVINQENFDESWGDWTTFSVIGDEVWTRDNIYGIGGTPCAQMSGFNVMALENEDWLISPTMDFDLYNSEVLSFYTAMNYIGDPLQILISENYQGGDPTLADWNVLTAVLSPGAWAWTSSGDINISGYNGMVNVAFVFTSNNVQSSTWEVDDILITGNTGTTPIINVFTPVAGANWIRGNAYNITWGAFNTLANAVIEVTANASAGTPVWTELATVAANAGTWTWNIPGTQALGPDYRIRISDEAADVTALSGIFSVIDPPVAYDIVINEIMYNPPGELGVDDDWEYLELYNNEVQAVDLSNWYFSQGITYTFESGTVIQPGAYLVVARVPDTIAEFYGITNLVGPFGGALGNSGETLELSDAIGTVIDIVTYSDVAPWPTEPDGSGPSLSLIHPTLDNELPENWLPSLENFGTPGLINFPEDPVITVNFPNGGELLQQEMNYDIQWSSLNFTGNVKIELLNNGSVAEVLAASVDVSIGTWEWAVPATQPMGNQFKIRISDVIDGDPSDESNEVFSIIELVEVPKLVITEIMYNPPEVGTDSLEFIEIYNNDNVAVDMTDFQFTSGIEFIFPQITINAGDYVVVAVNAPAMLNTFGVESYQWTSGGLNNTGELIELSDNFGNVVDGVMYADQMPWDSLADGYGPSLTFCDPNLDNSIAEYWAASTEFAAVNAANDSIFATPGTGCLLMPHADFVADNTSIQEGQSVNFTNLSTNASTWAWTFEGGTPGTFAGQTPPAITYNNAGTYDVTLIVSNDAGEDTEIKVDYIEVFNTPPPPAANFTANVTTINVGGSVNFTDLSTNSPTSWAWTFEGGTPGTSTQQNPSNITYNTAGTFDVTLMVSNQYGSDTEIKLNYITVQVIPPPQAAFTANVTNIYVGETVTFTNQSTGNPTAWAWTFEGGTPGTSNQQNPAAVTYNTVGIYDVSLMVSNANGSTTANKIDYITVSANSGFNLVITEIMYNPPEAGDDILEYIEIFNNSSEAANLTGLYFAQGIVFEFPEETLDPGAYYVVAIDAAAFNTAFGFEPAQWTSGALSNSGETLEIKDALGNTIDIVTYSDQAPWPTAPDGTGPSLTFCDPTIDNNVGENWYSSIEFAGQNAAGDDLYGTPGTVCEFVGVDELSTLTEMSIYPNPASTQFTVSLPQPGNWQLQVFNLTGKVIFDSNTNGDFIAVNSDSWPGGIYLIKATSVNSNTVLTQKLIIE